MRERIVRSMIIKNDIGDTLIFFSMNVLYMQMFRELNLETGKSDWLKCHGLVQVAHSVNCLKQKSDH